MTTLAVYSIKGGVGKTAAAVNISFLAAKAGLRTLVVDLDPQSSATYYFRVKPKIKKTARGLFRWHKGVDQSIKGTDYENLDLLPADFTHRNLDIIYNRLRRSKHRLERIVKPLEKDYKLIIIDCSATINILAENIFNTAEYLLVPIIPTTLSVRTYTQLRSFLKKKNFKLANLFAFFSMVDRRKNMHNELIKSVSKKYSGIFKTNIPYLSIIEKMGIERQPVLAYAPNSIAAVAYEALWSEIREACFRDV